MQEFRAFCSLLRLSLRRPRRGDLARLGRVGDWRVSRIDSLWSGWISCCAARTTIPPTTLTTYCLFRESWEHWLVLGLGRVCFHPTWPRTPPAPIPPPSCCAMLHPPLNGECECMYDCSNTALKSGALLEQPASQRVYPTACVCSSRSRPFLARVSSIITKVIAKSQHRGCLNGMRVRVYSLEPLIASQHSGERVCGVSPPGVWPALLFLNSSDLPITYCPTCLLFPNIM